jgi:hypothetical protein
MAERFEARLTNFIQSLTSMYGVRRGYPLPTWLDNYLPCKGVAPTERD